ncbi:hypothetical protein ACQEU8_02415 [Streptomyces sp. CA-250714]|uniref:hypothetical protein n=1 Tax=Streptomyces sp. CA-250714 TaxID=3240060 RepID=UPI003D8B19AA
MSARESIENLWDRATLVAPLLDAYRAEVLREAADAVDEMYKRDYPLAGVPFLVKALTSRLRRMAEQEDV